MSSRSIQVCGAFDGERPYVGCTSENGPSIESESDRLHQSSDKGVYETGIDWRWCTVR